MRNPDLDVSGPCEFPGGRIGGKGRKPVENERPRGDRHASPCLQDPVRPLCRHSRSGRGHRAFRLHGRGKDLGGGFSKVSPERGTFRFSAPRDGVYWFAVSAARQGEEADTRLSPSIKVKVETGDQAAEASPKPESTTSSKKHVSALNSLRLSHPRKGPSFSNTCRCSHNISSARLALVAWAAAWVAWAVAWVAWAAASAVRLPIPSSGKRPLLLRGNDTRN